MLFGLFKSKKEDTVSREVAVYLREKLAATEAELENLAAHSEKLISENTMLLEYTGDLGKSNYYFDLACEGFKEEAEDVRSQLEKEKEANTRLFAIFLAVVLENLDLCGLVNQKVDSIKLLEEDVEFYKGLYNSADKTNVHLFNIVQNLKQDLAASRKACEHMRKTRH